MKKNPVKNQRGQGVVEAILLITLFLGISTMVAKTFVGQDFFTTIVKGPWQNLSGMIQAGVWAPPAQAYSQHPALMSSRHQSLRGDQR